MKDLGTKDVMKEYISEIKSTVNLVELKKIKYFSDTGTELSEEVKQLPNDKVANSRLGWYRRSGMNVVNFIISPDLLENKIKDGAGLLNPLNYYLR